MFYLFVFQNHSQEFKTSQNHSIWTTNIHTFCTRTQVLNHNTDIKLKTVHT